jgi:hypothetical protein
MDNKNDFLPNDYKLPDNSGYMKFTAGENTFRILSSAITGFEYFTKENKPVRSQTPFTSTPDIKVGQDGKKTIKHFWAFVVYNYNAEAIQILEITQKTIQGAIKALVDNKKWGSPMAYDITVTKVGESLETEYNIMPNPHSELPKEISEDYQNRHIDLTALYRGENPFEEKQITEDIPAESISFEDFEKTL